MYNMYVCMYVRVYVQVSRYYTTTMHVRVRRPARRLKLNAPTKTEVLNLLPGLPIGIILDRRINWKNFSKSDDHFSIYVDRRSRTSRNLKEASMIAGMKALLPDCVV